MGKGRVVPEGERHRRPLPPDEPCAIRLLIGRFLKCLQLNCVKTPLPLGWQPIWNRTGLIHSDRAVAIGPGRCDRAGPGRFNPASRPARRNWGQGERE